MNIRRKWDDFNEEFRSRYMDIGKPENVIIVAGMGRSGTTWVAEMINYDDTYRVMFEPFLASLVREAEGFQYIQYLRPYCTDSVLTNRARSILAGKVRHEWVDERTHRIFYRRRIVKEIRCNLMLGWLKQIANHPPIVLVIRHPLQVAASWRKLQWTREQLGIDSILAQETLLRDFPVIADVQKWIDPQDFVENIVFQWCIVHLVPSLHLKQDEAYAIFYENLLTELAHEIPKLFQYLNKPFSQKILPQILSRPSWTNWLERDFKQDRPSLLNSWKDEFSTQQKRKVDSILAAFELDHIYDKNGFPIGIPFFRD